MNTNTLELDHTASFHGLEDKKVISTLSFNIYGEAKIIKFATFKHLQDYMCVARICQCMTLGLAM
jgi:hypothetical protein